MSDLVEEVAGGIDKEAYDVYLRMLHLNKACEIFARQSGGENVELDSVVN